MLIKKEMLPTQNKSPPRVLTCLLKADLNKILKYLKKFFLYLLYYANIKYPVCYFKYIMYCIIKYIRHTIKIFLLNIYI